MTQLGQTIQQHTPQDLYTYGERYGICYRFPTLTPQTARRTSVIRGHILELAPARGVQLVASDIDVLQRYDSRSHRATPLSIIIMLEGKAEVSLSEQRLELSAGMALSVTLDSQQGLQATQPPGQRIRALTFAFNASRLAELGANLPPCSSSMHSWMLPPFLCQALEQAISSSLDGTALNLLWEGLSLQLLAHGLPPDISDSCTRISPDERQRLEQIRSRLYAYPAATYSTAALAKQAAMSPATLRRKFQATYGSPIFEFLRERRLELAHELLMQGHSVERVAQRIGYQHANNFTTAFHQRYGYPPSGLRRVTERRKEKTEHRGEKFERMA